MQSEEGGARRDERNGYARLRPQKKRGSDQKRRVVAGQLGHDRNESYAEAGEHPGVSLAPYGTDDEREERADGRHEVGESVREVGSSRLDHVGKGVE